MLLGLVLYAFSGRALAAPQQGRVVIHTQPEVLNAATRIRSELETDGFEVLFAGDGQTVPEEAVATLRVSAIAEGVRVDLSVEPEAGGAPEERTFRATEAEFRTLALRVVEYVRASRIEVKPEQRARAAPRGQAPELASFRVELGAAAFPGAVGDALPVGLALALGVRFAPAWWLEVRAVSFAWNTVERNSLSTRLSHSLAVAGLRWSLLEGPPFGVFVGAAGGVYRVAASGETTAALVAREDSQTTAAGTLGAGLSARLSESGQLTALIRGDILAASARTGVRFAGEVVGRSGRVMGVASLGIGASF